MLRREVTNAAVLDDPHQPPIAVAVIQQHHGVSLRRIRLALDSRDEIVKRINEFKINVL